jgi:phospholipase/carboxylesterase
VPSLPRSTTHRGRALGPELTPYATFSPIHYEDGYAYPLIIWLHGAAGNEQQLRRVIPTISMRNYVAIAPRGTESHRRVSTSFSWQQTDAGIEEAEARVFDCLSIATGRFNVHTERVFLAGVGCGGTMAVRLAWSHPEKFAGAASFGGPLPTRNRPLRKLNSLRHLPCFLATGRKSGEYPEVEVCRDLRLLHSAGCTVALRQYPCGDDLTTAMLADLNRWLMELVTG